MSWPLRTGRYKSSSHSTNLLKLTKASRIQPFYLPRQSLYARQDLRIAYIVYAAYMWAHNTTRKTYSTEDLSCPRLVLSRLSFNVSCSFFFRCHVQTQSRLVARCHGFNAQVLTAYDPSITNHLIVGLKNTILSYVAHGSGMVFLMSRVSHISRATKLQ